MKSKFTKTTGLTITIFFVFLFGLTQAQQHQRQGPPPIPSEEQIEKIVTDLSSELSLTEEQENQVSALYFSHFKEVGELREKKQAEREKDRQEMEALRTEFEKKVKSHLTEEQQVKYDEFREKCTPRKSGKKPQRR